MFHLTGAVRDTDWDHRRAGNLGKIFVFSEYIYISNFSRSVLESRAKFLLPLVTE